MIDNFDNITDRLGQCEEYISIYWYKFYANLTQEEILMLKLSINDIMIL